MGWEDLNEPERSGKQEPDQKIALRRAVRDALGGSAGSELVSYLYGLAYRPSFVPGRSVEEVAYYEGIRKLAVDLLKLGGLIVNRGDGYGRDRK